MLMKVYVVKFCLSEVVKFKSSKDSEIQRIIYYSLKNSKVKEVLILKNF